MLQLHIKCTLSEINRVCTILILDNYSSVLQVVNGVKYSLALQVGMSECRNDGYTATLEQCPVSFDMVCSVNVHVVTL